MKGIKKLISTILLSTLSLSLMVGCGSSKENNKTVTVFNCGDYIDEDLIDKYDKATAYTVN